MDRKSIFVLIGCFALLMLWQYLVPLAFPPTRITVTNQIAGATNAARPGNSNNVIAAATNPPANAALVNPAPAAVVAPNTPEELLVITNQSARYTITSHGGGLKLVELTQYPAAVACRLKNKTNSTQLASLNTLAPLPVLAVRGGDALPGNAAFKLSRTASGVRAETQLPNGVYLVKEFQPLSNYLVSATVRLENRSGQALALPAQDWVVGTATPMSVTDDEVAVGAQWYNGASARSVDQGWFANRTLGCFPGTPRSEYLEGDTNIVWAAVNNQFFTLVVMPREPAAQFRSVKIDLAPPTREQIAENPKANLKPFGLETSVIYGATNLAAGQVVEWQFTLYAGPKEYRTLEKIGFELKNNIEQVMGYNGFFGWFARVLLLSMNGLHSLGLPYGWTIIAITVIIKLLFWPLTQAQTRSMKRMQALQPQMNAIKEKFKDDPTKMNKKMMEFMKENKVNPLGGCAPMLLQIPVFFGFFTMIRSAIELRGAPFLWICDLSQPDTLFVIAGYPFNLLPLLMGVTMLWQARMTPASPGMDPSQQAIMKYMPLIFLVILYNYSAGLTLYWTVQNLLTIAQMKLTKAKGPPAGVAVAPPAPVGKKK